VLHPLEWPEPKLAYALDPSFGGRGLATEAAGDVRKRAFEQFDLSRLAGSIVPANARSARVAEPLGLGHLAVAPEPDRT
jgi:RimJ/RimL family protein N-acetyltransferase